MKRVLIANRGEIAVRVIRACQARGLETVLAISTADRDSLASRMADRVVCVGPQAAKDSYLNMEAIVCAALGSKADAIHPGYGFLSERAPFAKLVAEAGLKFVGPRYEVIDLMGDKVQAREQAAKVGAPIPPGTGRIVDVDAANAFAAKHRFPLLLKASAGGGGRGMRMVRKQSELGDALSSASAEAAAAFGDPGIFVERYIERARHVEVQIIADEYGNVVHLGERDCSVQRRYQKLIEEAPSAAISALTRERLTTAAVRIAESVGYTNAGTVEFVLDDDTEEFFFLEMNTRVQVEHPVTEFTTGLDIVGLQLDVADGKPLPFKQGEVALTGHAIECRINAENANNNFRPSPGLIQRWSEPTGQGIRVDSHCFSGYRVPPFYDSLLGKVIVHAESRNAAIRLMSRALAELEVDGIETTRGFHQAVIESDDYASNRITTRWVEETFLKQWKV